jgi:hypothetical protein
MLAGKAARIRLFSDGSRVSNCGLPSRKPDMTISLRETLDMAHAAGHGADAKRGQTQSINLIEGEKPSEIEEVHEIQILQNSISAEQPRGIRNHTPAKTTDVDCSCDIWLVNSKH